jgi:polysaccharide deacetylase 2 family uncharacterized protein YibQ
MSKDQNKSWKKILVITAKVIFFVFLISIIFLIAYAWVASEDTVSRRQIKSYGFTTVIPELVLPEPSVEEEPEVVEKEIAEEKIAEKPKSGIVWQDFKLNYEPQEETSKIILLVTGLGLHEEETQQAIAVLPAYTTIGISPYSENLGTFFEAATAHNHEVLLDIPLESADQNNINRGNLTLLSESTLDENSNRLRTILRRAEGYVGLFYTRDQVFTQKDKEYPSLLNRLMSHGILVLSYEDPPQYIKTPYYGKIRMKLDEILSPEDVYNRLKELEELSKTELVIGEAQFYPYLIPLLNEWSNQLAEKNIAIVPVSYFATLKDNKPEVLPIQPPQEESTAVTEESQAPPKEAEHETTEE